MIWLTLLLPLCVPVVAAFYYKQGRSLSEYMIHIVVTVVVTTGVFYAGKYYPAMDFEVLNGYVTNKKQVYNPRTEYYECNCRSVTRTSGTGKNKTTYSSRECSTCSRIIPEWDWTVFTTVGNININRIDSDGRREPSRWTKACIGEPASLEHTYINQIKGVRDSIFHYNKDLVESYKEKVPEYPEVKDYYRFNRVLNNTKIDTNDWNDYLNDRLKSLGVQKQVNIITVVTDEPYEFADALKYMWLGGKKNDVVMMFGNKDGKISWFSSTSLADGYKNQTLHARLRMNAHNKDINMELLKEQIDIVQSDFERIPMEEFDYLTSESEPPMWVIILAIILGVSASIATSYGLNRFSNRRGF
ncbi:MAG: hypothetical protein [Caudoviricetes sp.]|nr:MAG: hypothetical protein [Caudoviricetes sp.]